MNNRRKKGASSNLIFPGAEYTAEQIEFMLWIQKCKESTRIYKPTWAEVLRWAKALGYRKVEKKLTP